jgi:hypothetical protein
MRLRELTGDDPIMDLVRAKEAGFHPDALDQLVQKFVAADAQPVAVSQVSAHPLAPVSPTPKAPAQVKPQPPAPQARPIQQAPGSVAWTQVRDYLASKGLSKSHIIGMLANIEHESQFKPQVLVKDSNGLPSGGLFQHNGPRLTTLVNKLGQSWTSNWKGQIDFALNEPDGQRYVGQQFKDPTTAAKWWTVNFERPANKQHVAQVRGRTATKYQAAQKTR